MTQYFREKWLRLRIYKRKSEFAVDYQIIHNMAKMMGVKHGA